MIAARLGDVVEAERLFRVAAGSSHPEAGVSGAISLADLLTVRKADAEARQHYARVAGSGHARYAPEAAAKLERLPVER